MILLPDSSVVIVDIETTETALSEIRGEFPEMVEIAACIMDSDYEVRTVWSSLVRPSRIDDFTDFSESFTGIKLSEVCAAEPWSVVWKEFAKFVGWNARRFVSWGAGFDQAVLRNEYWRAKVPWPHKYPWVDALSIVYQKSGEWGFKLDSWKLDSACERFGIEKEVRHRALGGARRVAQVLKAIAELE